MNIVSTWLTINRSCNLACKWCYAQKINKENNMELNTAKNHNHRLSRWFD